MSSASIEMKLLRLKLQGTALTPREKAVLRRYALGDNGGEIARRYGKSHETIKAQTKLIRARLGARTMAHAVAIAISLDLI